MTTCRDGKKMPLGRPPQPRNADSSCHSPLASPAQPRPAEQLRRVTSWGGAPRRKARILRAGGLGRGELASGSRIQNTKNGRSAVARKAGIGMVRTANGERHALCERTEYVCSGAGRLVRVVQQLDVQPS